jgi:glycosyltransferase involved in cell wall biosynthesis
MIPINAHTAEFGIIMTSFGRVALLESAIRSVRNQSDANWVLYIIDDNSAGRGYLNTKKVILGHALEDTRIVPIIRTDVTNEKRRQISWVENINLVLNDIVDRNLCKYVQYSTCDDFKSTNQIQVFKKYLKEQSHRAVVGRLSRTIAPNWVSTGLLPAPHVRIISGNGLGVIDHNGIAHQVDLLKKIPRPYWTMDMAQTGYPDGVFINDLLRIQKNIPITTEVVGEKRIHKQSMHGRFNNWPRAKN